MCVVRDMSFYPHHRLIITRTVGAVVFVVVIVIITMRIALRMHTVIIDNHPVLMYAAPHPHDDCATRAI